MWKQKIYKTAIKERGIFVEWTTGRCKLGAEKNVREISYRKQGASGARLHATVCS